MRTFVDDIKTQNGVVLSVVMISICIMCLIFMLIFSNTTFAANNKNEVSNMNIEFKENSNIFNIEEILNSNKLNVKREEYYIEEKEMEYITLYEKTDTLPKDEIQIYKEGQLGVQENIYLKKYEQNELVSEELIAKGVKKAPTSKIVYVGTYVEPVVEEEPAETPVATSSDITFEMDLNKPSGLTLEQFKKVLSNIENDTNNIFEDNAEYFYYVEKQYNINGIFLAALGIHESGWGKSQISLNKKNLFGYGANDSNPYNNAYEFDEYEVGIDLIARVLVKYYINEPGTPIYEGNAVGTYYNGSNLEGINVRYSSDDNWGNAVFKWMDYLYGRL